MKRNTKTPTTSIKTHTHKKNKKKADNGGTQNTLEHMNKQKRTTKRKTPHKHNK